MRSKLSTILILTLIASFSILSAAAFGAIPPPPVNQNLGILDSYFNNLAEADCRVCHGSSPPPGVPVDPTYLPDRHHLNVGTAVPGGACQETPNACENDADCYDYCEDDPTVSCTVDGDCPSGICQSAGGSGVRDNYCVGESDRPYPSGDTGGNYDCFSCHALVWDGSAFVMEVFRDCTYCHKVEFQPDHPDRTQGLNVHHRTAIARSGDCVACHGNLVQNGVLDTDGDGFADKRACDGVVSIPGQCDWIPTYQPSLVTPWPSEKNFGRCDETCDVVALSGTCGPTGGEACTDDSDCGTPGDTCSGQTSQCSVGGEDCTADPTICGGSDTQCVTNANCTTLGEVCNLDLDGGGGGSANSRGHEEGNCNYCHDSSNTETCVAGFCSVSTSTACEADHDCNGPILINHDTHHYTGATGLVPFGASCGLCHPSRTPTRTTADMRGCERCHGFPSLHNIQVDSQPDGQIIPNGEDPYYGHIGSNTDCNGCHGFTAANAPGSGAVIPFISSADDLTVTAGTDATVTLTGVALTNLIDTGAQLIELTSVAELTAADGTVTSITPDSVTQTEMVVTLSGLSAGNYHLRAVKGPNASNPVVVTVTSAVAIADSNCNKKKGVLTINGSGFAQKVEGTDAYINVDVDGQTVDVISWSDTEIKASVSSCKSGAITVNALYGSASSGSGGGGKPDRPCKGKKCN